MNKITYWIPVRTIAGTEKDKWYQCSKCGNMVNTYDIEQLRFEHSNNLKIYENERKSRWFVCENCNSEMDVYVTRELEKRRIAKGDYGKTIPDKIIGEIMKCSNYKFSHDLYMH